MEVEVISEQCIQPSSPTPHHLRDFKLSLLDQFIPTPNVAICLFYPMNEDNSRSSISHLIELSSRRELLKSSLSDTLTRFYPLAGKIKDDLSIDCNDEGANYVETSVNCPLSSFLSYPDLLLIHKFFPCEVFPKDDSTKGTYVTNIQLNMFECGGIAIGLCISHKILDGAALTTFLKCWSASAQGCSNICPDFIATSLFPADDLWLRDSSMVMWGSLLRKGNCVTKRFVFDASAIATLKAKVTNSGEPCPTKVQAVSAFIWKAAMAAVKQKHGFSRPSLLSHAVNLRKRTAALPLSDRSMGNLNWIATAQCNIGKNSKQELHGLVGEIKESISRIDADFVEKLHGGGKGEGYYSVICETLKEIEDFVSKDGVDYFGFTSWCNFGLYEVDFGWGKPIWVSHVGISLSVFLNVTTLIDTKCGEGIEAWMTLDEQEMDILEHDMELLSLASLDSSPLLNLIDHSLTLKGQVILS